MSTSSFPDRIIVRYFAANVLKSNVTHLGLLQWFDAGEPHLLGHTSAVFGLATQTHDIAERLRTNVGDEPIDGDAVTDRLLNNAISTVPMVIALLQAKSARIGGDRSLAPDLVATSIDAYAEAIDAQWGLRDALTRLKREVCRHDAQVQKLRGPFPEVKKMLDGILQAH